MRLITELISECREDTGNQSYNSQTGISDSKFVRALNYGLENAQGIITKTNPKLFYAEKIIDIVANQESYEIPDRLYLGTRIVNVEYSHSGESRDYIKIFEQGLIRRNTNAEDYVLCYIRRNGSIFLSPIPSSAGGKLRVTYERQLDTLALRAGQIDAVTIAGGLVTVVSLDDATDEPTLIVSPGYFCICDKDGTVKAYNIPFSAYSTGTGNFTLTSTAPVTGLTPAIGDYVTIGKYTTTHGALADPVERYVKAYANWEVLSKDTAGQVKAKYFLDQLNTIRSEIIESYQEADKDEDEIQIVNSFLIVR